MLTILENLRCANYKVYYRANANSSNCLLFKEADTAVWLCTAVQPYKAKRQYLLTFQVSGYCCLAASHGSIRHRIMTHTSASLPVYTQQMTYRDTNCYFALCVWQCWLFFSSTVLFMPPFSPRFWLQTRDIDPMFFLHFQLWVTVAMVARHNWKWVKDIFFNWALQCTTHVPANTKYLYNICTMLVQGRRRWADVVQMLYMCFVPANKSLTRCSFNCGPASQSASQRWNNIGLMCRVCSGIACLINLLSCL